MAQDNVLARRRILVDLIDRGCVDDSVLAELLPNGVPVADEDLLWDFKETLPVLRPGASKEERDAYAREASEVVKDAVAFHNMYGGYLLVGVRDADRHVVGFSEQFDANDLCKKIFGATRATIDIKYRRISRNNAPPIGLIYIPQRQAELDPVQFLKDAPQSPTGQRAYRANDIYMRAREECRAATTAADFALLFQREKLASGSVARERSYIENNLPAKDPNLLEFVGREEQLDTLWKWFADRYTAVKLLSGAGGVGKTSIAWTFCDAVSQSPPTGLSKVVWLTAKKKTFVALQGRYFDIDHTHFSDLPSLLLALLGELGVPASQIPEDPSREDLVEECIAAVKAWPCLLVVDDIDSLPNEHQNDVFRTISMIFDRVIASGVLRARALLTARLNLGAAPGQLLKITGLPLPAFKEYAITAAEAINAPLPQGENGKTAIKNLYDASSGSPLFAASILRLVALGEPLSRAIKQYKGADGEEVRRFAFGRELESLTDSQLRLLFAAMHLPNCTVAELIEATQTNRTIVRDDIAALRDYHLMSLTVSSDEFARDDVQVSVPKELVSMSDLLRKKITDPTRIETNCARLLRSDESANREAAKLFNRVVQYWAEEDFSLALEAAEFAAKKLPRNPDVWCLLGRAHIKSPDIDWKKADAALRKAAELGSVRPELLPLRVEAKEALADWIGIIQLLEEKDRRFLSANETLSLAKAHQLLGDEQGRLGNWESAEDYYIKGATIIRDAFDSQRAYGQVEVLKSLKHDLMIAYVSAVARKINKQDQRIEVWDAVGRAMQYEVFNRATVSLGINSAVSWSEAVLRREHAEETTLKRLESMVQALERLPGRFRNRGPGWLSVSQLAESGAAQMARAAVQYRSKII